MNEIHVTPAELAQSRRLVSMFRGMGASDYEACMLTAQLQIAQRGTP
ncbi:hypothetical protein [Arthrobacter sp. PsM3]|nr:hypothetical protein [Arthrobacter sp. PsM3]MDN4644971.1 hypothetical protein [Arthrobacter sp. PsM3]